jgi:hypothetical protein
MSPVPALAALGAADVLVVAQMVARCARADHCAINASMMASAGSGRQWSTVVSIRWQLSHRLSQGPGIHHWEMRGNLASTVRSTEIANSGIRPELSDVYAILQYMEYLNHGIMLT